MVIPAVAAVAVLAVGGVGFGHAIARGQAPHASAGLTGPPAASPVLPAAPATTSSSTPSILGSPPAVTGTSVSRPTVSAAPTSAPASASASPKLTHRPRAHHHVAPAALRIVDAGSACYVQVTTSHGHLLVREILHGGQSVTFRHHGLIVVLGNAGGVRISVDGHRLHHPGRSGQVRRFRVR
jgi:Domain of unknown function (DUF4115)